MSKMMNTKEELIAIIKKHASKYTRMQPRDVVKLLYQNEFGGGHLITDEKMCLERIRREYASTEHAPEPSLHNEQTQCMEQSLHNEQTQCKGKTLHNEQISCKEQSLCEEQILCEERPLCSELLPYEEIGNGMVRVNLAAISDEGSLEKLCEAFMRSSAIHQGSMENFKEKLNILADEYAQFGFSFSKQELEEYLEGYAKEGYPMVSHSDIYRETYRPAYRVVCKEIMY